MKYKEKDCKNNNINEYLLAFIYCGFSMFLFLKLSMLQFDSLSTLITGDSLELYVPGLMSLVRNVREGNSLTYSFDLSMGMNAVEYYAAVVGGSLVNLIYLVFNQLPIEDFLIIAITLKSSLIGVCFVYFMRRVLGTRGYANVLFSIFYALCGFQVSINSINFIWMDMVYMLPLILAFIVVGIQEDRWARLIVAYAYLFLCNFYIAYIVGFFSAIFFILYLILNTEYVLKDKFFKILKYGICVAIAIGMVAVVIIPTADFMLTKYPMQTSNYNRDIIGKNIFIYIQQLTFGNCWDESRRYPYIYSGLLSVLLLPFYIRNRMIALREKITYLLLLGIMGISCICLPLYIFWHGYDEPDMWYYRFGFIISFLLIVMACKEYSTIQSAFEKKEFLIVAIEILIIVTSLYYCYKNNCISNSQIIIYNALIMFGWIFLLYVYPKYEGRPRTIVCAISLGLAITEMVANGCIGHSIYQDKQEMVNWEQSTEEALKLLQDDDSFYRVNYENDFIMNSDTYFGYHGIADFASFENVELRETLKKLGAYTSSRVTLGYGLNKFTQMILDVKYSILGSSDTENPIAIVSTYDKVLNLGFVVNQDIVSCELDGTNPYENCNILASAMVGEKLSLFEPIPEKDLIYQSEGIYIGENENGKYVYSELNTDETQYLHILVPNNGEEAYGTFGEVNRGIRGDTPQVCEPTKTRNNGQLSVTYSKKLDDNGDYLRYSIGMKRGITNNYYEYGEAFFYYTNSEAFKSFYECLSKNQLQITSYKNGEVNGVLNVTEKNQILFTSIPYDRGWKVYSQQGELETLPLVEGAFLGVCLPEEGTYELHMVYEVPGGRIGMIVTIVSSAILLIYMLLSNFYRIKKDNNVENVTE